MYKKNFLSMFENFIFENHFVRSNTVLAQNKNKLTLLTLTCTIPKSVGIFPTIG